MRRPPPRLRGLPLAIAAAVFLAGCGGAAVPGTSAAPSPTPATASPDPTGAAPDGIRTPSSAPTAPTTPDIQAATPAPTLAPSEPFSTAEITLEGDGTSLRMPVYVADTPDLRGRGLMERESLPSGTGMVFLFDEDTTGAFWMRDTVLPLSIAFADADGVIVDIQDMEPCPAMPCPQYGPGQPYRTALEVPQGWFADVGVASGWRITDLPER